MKRVHQLDEKHFNEFDSKLPHPIRSLMRYLKKITARLL